MHQFVKAGYRMIRKAWVSVWEMFWWYVTFSHW